MLSSAMILKNGKDFSKNDQKLFCEIFLVNLKLLKLFTFTGHLDLSQNGYVDNILHTWNRVNLIDSEYKALTQMSFAEKKMFEDQVFRARITLQYLANQVPRQMAWLFWGCSGALAKLESLKLFKCRWFLFHQIYDSSKVILE